MPPRALVIAASSLLAHQAFAESYSREDFSNLEARLTDVAPLPGLDRAPRRPPAWCRAVKPESGFALASWAQAIEDARDPLRAARMACSLPGNESAVQRGAAIIEQHWINASGLSEVDAVMSLSLRLDEAAYDAGKQELCGALVASGEADAETTLYTKSRRQLLGCDANYPSWRDDMPAWHDPIATYFDQSVVPADDLAKLGYVLERIKPAFEDAKYGNATKYLASYAIDAYDAHALATETVARILGSAPYKGNPYARAVIIESFARVRMGIAILDARAAKLAAADADWKQVLFEAPKRGVEGFIAATKPYAAQIARSNQFEHDLASGSKRRVADCIPALRADFMTTFAPLRHADVAEATTSLSESATSLLFQRLVACTAATHEVSHLEGDDVRALEGLLARVRRSRGPRAAIYYAQLEAVAKVLADRPKFPFSLDRLAFDMFGVNEASTDRLLLRGSKGVVASVTTKGDRVQVEFVEKIVRERIRNCVNTGRPILLLSDGTILYEQHCTLGGWHDVDHTPPPVTFGRIYAEHIARGTFLEADGDFPVAVYKDASKQTLVNFFGFPL